MIKGDFLNIIKRIMFKSGIMSMLLLFSLTIPVFAVDTVPTEEEQAAYEQRKTLPVDTNMLPDWSQGPIIGAEAAILMEVDTGTILYSKNIDERLYPASITKMMTGLLVMEHCQLDDVVTFSKTAIENTEWGSSRIGIQAGEELTVENCLYGLLLGSANEVAYGLAEQVGGDLSTFVSMMNEKAAELGCVNTHFANASGLPDPEHYVSARDMAIIGREFFKNETLAMISGTYTYTIPMTNKVKEERPLDNHHKMISGKKYEYDGIVGGKTGYTSLARQTLVTCAQRNGMKLLCVVMKDEAPHQFLDTESLLDYGFEHFQKLPISSYEDRYNLSSRTFFDTNLDVMGSSRSILSLNKEGYVIIPKTLEFEQVQVNLEYLDNDSNAIARLIYSVDGNYVGSTTIDYATDTKTFEFAKILTNETDKEPQKVVKTRETIFVSVKSIIVAILKILGLLLLIVIIVALINRYIKSAKRQTNLDKKRYKSRSENSMRSKRAYKKRSENRHRKDPTLKQNKSGQSIYQEMMKRSEQMNKFNGENYFDKEDEETPKTVRFVGNLENSGKSRNMPVNTYQDFDDDDDMEFETNYMNYESKEIDIFEDDNRPIW